MEVGLWFGIQSGHVVWSVYQARGLETAFIAGTGGVGASCRATGGGGRRRGGRGLGVCTAHF